MRHGWLGKIVLAIATLIPLHAAWGQASAPGVPPFIRPTFGVWYAPGGIGPLTPSAVLISSQLLPALGTTDFGANAHIISDGYTADVTLNQTTDASPTFAHFAGLYQPSYSAPLGGFLPTPTSNYMSFTDTRPGYTCTAGLGNGCVLGTVNTTVYATVPLRQPFGTTGSGTAYNNPIAPTSGANINVAVALSDPVFSGDNVGVVTFASGFYNAGTPSPANTVTPTVGALPAYPAPIVSWMTPPGQYFNSANGFTVEVECGAPTYGPSTLANSSCAGVTVTASDGTHSVTRTATAMALSQMQVSATGTVANGSNCITGLSSTDGFNLGDRVTLYGVPGFPTVLSKTASQICLGNNLTATFTTGSPGTITLLAPANGNGQAFADGALVGASISGANINAGVTPAVISNASGVTWAFKSATITSTGSNPKYATSATITTNATATTSGTAQAVQILENYQGSGTTGTIFKGVPHYDYQVTFTPTDFSGTLTTAGNVSFEAKGYPQYGNAVTDSAVGMGALNVPGTNPDGCDWFALNIGSCTGAATFAAAGTDVSPNLHNLWANDDSCYSPSYIPIASTGTCTTSACIQTSATVPASGCTTTCAASPGAMLTAVKAYNNNGSNRTHTHNDINGAVFAYVSTGSPVTYLGFGGTLVGNITVKKPGPIFTSVVSGGTATPYGVTGSDPVNIVLGYSSTNNNSLSGEPYFNNLTLSSGTSVVVEGQDNTSPTAFPVSEFAFNNDIITPTAAVPILFRLGTWRIYNSQINEGLYEGNALSVYGNQTVGLGQLAFSTAVLSKYNTVQNSKWAVYNGEGNIIFGGGPTLQSALAGSNVFEQALSITLVDNAYINFDGGALMTGTSQTQQPINNLWMENNLCEYVGGASDCLVYSADSIFSPVYNVIDRYNTFIGGRSPHNYEEGKPIQAASVASTGGSLLHSTNYAIAVTLTNPGGSTEDAYDGASTITTSAGADTFSINFNLIPTNLTGNPEGGARSAYFYIVAGATTLAGGTTTRAIVSGCTQPCAIPAGGATFTITGVDSTTGTLPVLSGAGVLPAPWVGWSPLKTRVVQWYNLNALNGGKNETYAFGAGTWGSGGRIGNWGDVFGVSHIGNATVLGNGVQGVDAGTGPLGTTGMYTGWKSQPSTGNISTNITYEALKWKEDRSCGFGSQTCGVLPANGTTQYGLNIGAGDYCLKHNSPAGTASSGGGVPAGYATHPADIYGLARRNDGTGTAGAIEGNDDGSSGAAKCY